MPTFEIDGNSFLGDKLQIPADFAQYLADKCSKSYLIFVDTMQQKHVVSYDAIRKEISQLGSWYRAIGSTKNRTILVTVLDINEALFEIKLKEQSENQSEVEGLYIGRRQATVGARKYELGERFIFPLSDLLTHIFICGITGSGKTVLGKSIIEEAALNGIPSIIIDLKGDLSSMALVGSNPDDFIEWVDAKDDEVRKKKAHEYSKKHFSNLEQFSIDPQLVERFKNNVIVKIFTPRSKKGIPVGFSSPLGAPPYPTKLLEENPEDFNNLVASLVNAFLDRLSWKEEDSVGK